MGLLRRLLSGPRRSETDKSENVPAPPPAPQAPPTLPVATPQTQAGGDPQAREYLARVQAKIARLAEDFAAGAINRAQFQELYSHYQREIRSIEQVLEAQQGDWRGAVTAGQSLLIRKQHVAKAIGYAIYENESGIPLATLGSFEVDPALLVPMLSSYRSAAAEIFGGGVRSSAIEGGRGLCFVPGRHTTMIALFTVEPAPKQLAVLDDLHRVFESANHHVLAAPPVNPNDLLFPHEYYLGKWRTGT